MTWPPVEPPPSPYRLPDPRIAGDDDVVAVGGDLAPGMLLAAYRRGMFPMHLPDGRLAWWSPQPRGVLKPDGLIVSRSLRRSARRYTVTVDRDLGSVIDACADPSRPGAWIEPEIQAGYLELHRLGWVHSIEAWSEAGDLVGGLYGVAIGGLFAGESMFSAAVDASKVALLFLAKRMARIQGALIDVQWATPHLARLGAIEISRDNYLRLLTDAVEAPASPRLWAPPP